MIFSFATRILQTLRPGVARPTQNHNQPKHTPNWAHHTIQDQHTQGAGANTPKDPSTRPSAKFSKNHPGQSPLQNRWWIGLALLAAGGLVWHQLKPTTPSGPRALVVGLSPDYPPFEFYKKGQLTGLDVDLAKLLGKELGVPVHLQPMGFPILFVALANGTADLGISCIVESPVRRRHFDFSDPYFHMGMALVWRRAQPPASLTDLSGQKVGCQLGTTMQDFLKARFPKARVQAMENNLHVIEALRSGHVALALLETLQAQEFCEKDPLLALAPLDPKVLGEFASAFSVALPKNSPWTGRINKALARLERVGALKALRQRWTRMSQPASSSSAPEPTAQPPHPPIP